MLFRKKNKNPDAGQAAAAVVERASQQELKKYREYAYVQLWHRISVLIYVASIVYIWAFLFVYDPTKSAEVRQVAPIAGGKVAVGRVVTLPLPRYTEAAIRDWTNKAMNNVLNYSFLNFNQQVASYRQYFSDDGYESFTNYLKAHDLNSMLGRAKQNQRGTVIGQIIFVGGSKGFVDEATGRRYWQVIVPMDIARTAGKTTHRKAEYMLVIVLESDKKGRSGFFIDEMREK